METITKYTIASETVHGSRTEDLADTISASISGGIIGRELISIDAARDAYATLTRVYVHQDPVKFAQLLTHHIPENGQAAWPGYWPAFKGHHLETLNHKLYNLGHKGTGKYLVFDKPGMAKWDGSFYIDDRFAGKFQVKFGIDSITKSISKMKAEGCNPKKAVLFVPKDKLAIAQQKANGSITIKAIPLSSNAVDDHAQRGIRKIAHNPSILTPQGVLLRHAGMVGSSVVASVGMGAIVDEVQIARGYLTRHEYLARRKKDVTRGVISYAGAVAGKASLHACANYGLRFAATRGVAALALSNPVFAIGASFIATGLLTKLWRKIS